MGLHAEMRAHVLRADEPTKDEFKRLLPKTSNNYALPRVLSMTNKQTIDGVPRELLGNIEMTWRQAPAFSNKANDIIAAGLGELRALLAAERCTSCDGSGDIIDLTGEWRGYCACPTGVALKNKPSAQHQGEPVAWIFADSIGGIRWRPQVLGSHPGWNCTLCAALRTIAATQLAARSIERLGRVSLRRSAGENDAGNQDCARVSFQGRAAHSARCRSRQSLRQRVQHS